GRDYSLRHGRPLAAIECYRELLEIGERVGSRAAQAEACGQLALCLALVGEVAEADDQLARAGALVQELWPGHRLHLLGTLSSSVWFSTAAAWQLHDAEAASWLSPLIERHAGARGSPGPMASLDQAAGRIAALHGAGDEALACFSRAREAMEASGIGGVVAIL